MIGAALLLLASQPYSAPSPPVPAPSASSVIAPLLFAPPLGEPMTYRVTSRRLARSGAMVSYTLVYALNWHRAGRGLEFAATLRRIETDARPELAQMLTGLLQPLVGQPMSYLVAPDGSSVALIDPDAQWQRILGQVQDMGAGAAQGEAKQVAGLLAALSPAERDRLVTADIRALVAPANPSIPAAANGATDIVVEQDGDRRTVTQVERSDIKVDAPDAPQRIEVATIWTIDTATGLVLGEGRKTWAGAADGSGRRLVEERIRGLTAGDPE